MEVVAVPTKRSYFTARFPPTLRSFVKTTWTFDWLGREWAPCLGRVLTLPLTPSIRTCIHKSTKKRTNLCSLSKYCVENVPLEIPSMPDHHRSIPKIPLRNCMIAAWIMWTIREFSVCLIKTSTIHSTSSSISKFYCTGYALFFTF